MSNDRTAVGHPFTTAARRKAEILSRAILSARGET